MYLYLWKTEISRGSQEMHMDLLEAVSAVIKHAKQFPEVIHQSIVDTNQREVCVFRDMSFNGK